MKVKSVGLPQRCEICHQADVFDENINFCSRCNSLNAINSNNISKQLNQGDVLFEIIKGLGFIFLLYTSPILLFIAVSLIFIIISFVLNLVL